MHGQYRVNQYEWSKQTVVMLFGISESTMTICLCGITYLKIVWCSWRVVSLDLYTLYIYPAKSMTWKRFHIHFDAVLFTGCKFHSCRGILSHFDSPKFGPVMETQMFLLMFFVEKHRDLTHQKEFVRFLVKLSGQCRESRMIDSSRKCHARIRLWFQIFFMFTPAWGNDPLWLIFFKGGETTN